MSILWDVCFLSVTFVLHFLIAAHQPELRIIYKALPVLLQHPREHKHDNMFFRHFDENIDTVRLWKYKQLMGLGQYDAPVLWYDEGDMCWLENQRIFDILTKKKIRLMSCC
jgi:hypothetical protein